MRMHTTGNLFAPQQFPDGVSDLGFAFRRAVGGVKVHLAGMGRSRIANLESVGSYVPVAFGPMPINNGDAHYHSAILTHAPTSVQAAIVSTNRSAASRRAIRIARASWTR